MKILLAVDGSPYTKKMLAYLATHEAFFAPTHQYTLFKVQPPFPARVKSALGAEVTRNYHAEEAERVLAPAFKFLARHGLNPASSWKLGHPGEVIATFAQAGKFDMLVMGSHGHGALGNLVMGSVATQVLAHCTVPVLLVR
jgi:nucleotide-binding universal stress UspA family protein